MLHIKLDLSFDLADKVVHGTATHIISPLSDGLDHLVLDCVELTVEGVTDGKGRALPFDCDGEKLRVAFPKPLEAGHPAEVCVRYHGTPRSGLYFTGPSEACPDTAVQVWSQG
ncbi:MAG: hypothetical protein ACP5VF_00275 [Acidobacteriota bacterium]